MDAFFSELKMRRSISHSDCGTRRAKFVQPIIQCFGWPISERHKWIKRLNRSVCHRHVIKIVIVVIFKHKRGINWIDAGKKYSHRVQRMSVKLLSLYLLYVWRALDTNSIKLNDFRSKFLEHWQWNYRIEYIIEFRRDSISFREQKIRYDRIKTNWSRKIEHHCCSKSTYKKLISSHVPSTTPYLNNEHFGFLG